MEVRHALLVAGAKDSGYFECSNDNPEWLNAGANFSVLQMANWLTAAAAGSVEHACCVARDRLGTGC